MSFLDEVVDWYKNPDLQRTPWHNKDLGITSGITGYATDIGNNTGDFLKFLPKVTGHALSSMVPNTNSPVIGPVLHSFPAQLTEQVVRSMLPGVNTRAQNRHSQSEQERIHAVPTERTSAWDTEAQYAVLRNLTEADRNFTGIKTSEQATNKAATAVLKYLQKEGVTIDPEVAQGFKEGADQAIRMWMAGSMQDEQTVDVTEYYKFLTDAVLETQRSVDQDAADTSAPPAEGLTSTKAAYATGDPNYQQQQAPAQAAAAGDYSFMEATDPAQTTPTVNMLIWNGGFWGDDKPGLYGSQILFDNYLKWIQGVAHPTWDRTPAGYMKYAEKQVEGGT